MARYTLSVRRTGAARRERFDALEPALAALELAVGELLRGERRTTVRAFAREIEPAMQVAGRAEIAGPRGLRCGVDVRGDGSTEAFTGRWRRVVVEASAGEDASAALRRVLLRADAG